MVIPNNVIPRAAIAAGSTRYTTLEGSRVTVRLERDRDGDVEIELRAAAGEDAYLAAVDLTFGGAYDPAASAYVVHATRAPVCPLGRACPDDGDDDDGGGGGGVGGGVGGGSGLGPLLGPSGISDCKRLLDALPDVTYAGGTVFCPRNEGVRRLARQLGFSSVDLLLADMASATGTSLLVVANYMKFLIHPAAILTRASIPAGTTVLPSLLTPTVPTASIRLVRTGDGVELAAGPRENDPDADVEAFDLTFEGRYDAGASAYIVHGVEDDVGTFPVPGTFASLSAFFRSAGGGGVSFSTSSRFWRGLERRALRASGPVTLFVPTDAAWARLDGQSYTTAGFRLASVRRSAATREALARFHMFNTALTATAAGARLTVSSAPAGAADKPLVNVPAAGQVTGQISAVNVANILGVYQAGPYIIYAIDNVLLP
jgi:hypothetical protein